MGIFRVLKLLQDKTKGQNNAKLAPPLMVFGYNSPPLPLLQHLNMLNNKL